MSYIYLASPYTHADHSVENTRYHEAVNATTWLLSQRIWTFSPIVHCHPLRVKHSLPGDIDFWRDYNSALLINASAMYILTLVGWRDSRGIEYELGFADRNHIPVMLLCPLEPGHYTRINYDPVTPQV